MAPKAGPGKNIVLDHANTILNLVIVELRVLGRGESRLEVTSGRYAVIILNLTGDDETAIVATESCV